MEHDIMVVGAGGFGREAVWTLERINAAAPTWRVIGFADDDPAKAHGSLRFSLSRYTTEAEIDHVLSEMSGSVAKLRELSPFVS